ncbi:MAG: glycosyltransferase family 4 protein, partial [Chloroflexales bacterium]|nr:glycosyltransferase family 4 protein [Chloroflexales bacterium]
AWLEQSAAVWFEAARHYWWRPGLVRRVHGSPFPIVTMMHSLGYGFQFQPLVLSLVTPPCVGDTVIAPGAHAADVFRRQCENIIQLLELDVAPPNTAVVPYGVPPVPPLPRDAARALLGWGAAPVILFLGRLSYRDKADFDALFEAAARLASKAHVFRLVLAGSDAERQSEALRARANAYGIASIVEVIPNISDVDKHALLSACDIFVSPSNTTSESFGLTLIEAMLHARPIVCTAWSGYKEIVRDGIDGLLVDTWWHEQHEIDIPFVVNQTDSLASSVALDITQLASCLEHLLLQPERRQSMGESGKARAEALYLINTTAKNIVAVIEQAAERARGQRMQPEQLSFASILGLYASQRWTGAAQLQEDPALDIQRLMRTGSPQDVLMLKNDCLNQLVPGHADERFRLLRRGMARNAANYNDEAADSIA